MSFGGEISLTFQVCARVEVRAMAMVRNRIRFRGKISASSTVSVSFAVRFLLKG